MSTSSCVLGSRGVTVTISPSALWKAVDGIAVSYSLHDGPLTFTLTRQEATELHRMIGEQLASDMEPNVWRPAA